MVFSSPIFLYFFLPLALLAYYAAKGPSRLTILAAFSYLFYGWANIWYVPLILWMTLVDFCGGNLIGGHLDFIKPPGVGGARPCVASPLPRRTFLAVSPCHKPGEAFF